MGRKLGIDFATEAPWGSHFAYFYERYEELLKICIPFFRAGLESNEYCLWVTPKFDDKDLEQNVQRSIPNFQDYKKRHQFEIIPLSKEDLNEKDFFNRRLETFSQKYNYALENGFDGLRAVGDLSWAERKEWKIINDFERFMDKVIERSKIIAVCTYSMTKCTADYVLHILANHQLSFIRKREGFEIIEASLVKIKSKFLDKEIITRKKLEEQLIQSQKMEAVGRLAGGVAHDFNNLLTIILGHDEYLLKKLPPDDPLYRDAQEIQQAAERAATLTRQLLAFSRKQILQPRILNLNDLVEHVQGMLRRLIGEDIELITALDAALGDVEADPGQIEQVIMNLAINARDAMPQGGKLIIATANTESPVIHYCMFESLSPGRYINLSVSDTGVGMDAETLAHVFEPFYTTKELGKGTGLGLSTVYGIVKQNGGCIDIITQPGVGTTFQIYLPQVEKKRAVTETQPPTQLRGSETILVVEDEDMVRQLLIEALKRYGYQVLGAGNSDEAVSLAKGYQGPIPLLVTDVVLPKMDGRELAERLTFSHPEMKVLYMSGYMNDMKNHGTLDEDLHFIQKPFTPDALCQRIRQILDGSN